MHALPRPREKVPGNNFPSGLDSLVEAGADSQKADVTHPDLRQAQVLAQLPHEVHTFGSAFGRVACALVCMLACVHACDKECCVCLRQVLGKSRWTREWHQGF